MFKYSITLLSLAFVSACTTQPTGNTHSTPYTHSTINSHPALNTHANSDSNIFINKLLKINDPQFITQASDGTSTYHSLNAYKAWEALYIRYTKRDLVDNVTDGSTDSLKQRSSDKELTKTEIKKLLLIGYIAKLHADGATSQSLSSDLTPLYNSHSTSFLQVMTELPFLIPSTCYFLGNHFGFEDKHADKKTPFLKANAALLVTALGAEQGNACLEKIR